MKIQNALKYIALLCITIITIIACTKVNDNSSKNLDVPEIENTSLISKETHEHDITEKNYYTLVEDKTPLVRMTVVIRHGGDCYCEGCKCPGCPCPLGLCFCRDNGAYEEISPLAILSEDQVKEDIGSVFLIKQNENSLKMIFNNQTALKDGSIPITW